MSSLPRITIITPTYNQAHFIEQTIQSVLSQDYPSLEYIVMDGGSTDGTLGILKKYGDCLKWVSEKDRGQSHAINKAIRMATGDVVAYINSDDCYEPGALLRVGKFFASHPDAHWVTGECRIINRDGKEVRKFIKWYKNMLLWLSSYPLLQVVDYISQPATFWRRDIVHQVGFFDERLHFVMDYDYSLRVGRYCKLWVLHQPLADFRVHVNSKSTTASSAMFGDDLQIAARYTNSKFLLRLHALHSAVVVMIYWYIINQNQLVALSIPATGSEPDPDQESEMERAHEPLVPTS